MLHRSRCTRGTLNDAVQRCRVQARANLYNQDDKHQDIRSDGSCTYVISRGGGEKG